MEQRYKNTCRKEIFQYFFNKFSFHFSSFKLISSRYVFLLMEVDISTWTVKWKIDDNRWVVFIVNYLRDRLLMSLWFIHLNASSLYFFLDFHLFLLLLLVFNWIYTTTSLDYVDISQKKFISNFEKWWWWVH